MKKIFKINTANPLRDNKLTVGLAYRIDEISFQVKTIYGTFEALEEEIKFFESRTFLPTW